MDDFLAKPVALAALARAWEGWLPLAQPSSPAALAAAPPGRPRADAPLDRTSLALITGGDAAMEREILADFRATNDGDVAALREALARRDLAQVASAAHRVKGACRTVGAGALAAVCERMESAGRRNDWAGAAAEEEALARELERLNAWLVTA
jgi:HPt (histidine-containing phosphotransfer) domain-containing protein